MIDECICEQRLYRGSHSAILEEDFQVITTEAGWKRAEKQHCGKSDRLGTLEPLFTQIRRGLHVMHSRTVPAARSYQLMCIVAVRTADDDDDVGVPRQFDGGVLPLLCRPANGIDESHL